MESSSAAHPLIGPRTDLGHLISPHRGWGIDLIHDSRHVGFAIIMQISYTFLRGQITQVPEVITNILATQMICFMFIECLSPK